MRRIAQLLFALGVFVIGPEVRAAVSARYHPEEVAPSGRLSADSASIQPSPLPPAGIRAPLPVPARAIQHGPIPRDLPVPAGAPVFLEQELPTSATLPMPESPAPSSSFLALGDGAPTIQVIPPDTQGAVGTNRLLVAANSVVRVQQRDGSVVNSYELSSFFGSSSGGSGVYDPVTRYDPYSSRWILVACDDASKTTSAILVSASTSSDPEGVWNTWRFPADSTGVLWADRPQVGFNKDWVVVQFNMYTVSDSTWTRSDIYAIPKAGLYAGGTVNYSFWKTTDIGSGQVPVRTLDSTTSTVYMVQTWNSSNGTLALHSISGPVGSEILTKKIGFPATSATWSGSTSGDIGPQAGSSNFIDLGDSRMLDAVYRNGSIWASHTIFLPAGGSPSRAAAQWWQLSTSGSVIQRGRVDDSSGVTSFAYPSVAVNKDDAVLLGFSSFSADTFAGAAYAFRKSSDAAGSMQTSVLLKGGEAPYYKTFGGTKNRWGDYSATVVDPVNDTDMWTIQEYAAAPAGGTYPDRWSTWWGRIVPPSSGGPTGGPCTPSSTTLCLFSNRFQVTAQYDTYGAPSTFAAATATSFSDNTGFFTTVTPGNVDVVVKLVNFCSLNNTWSVYIGGTTDLGVNLTITDTNTSRVYTRANPFMNPWSLIREVAFTCP